MKRKVISTQGLLSCRHKGELLLRNEANHLCRLAYAGMVTDMKTVLAYGANPDAADYDGRTVGGR
jgi:hypothetical protein